MYEEEVSELNFKLNEYESIREELLNHIDDIETEVSEIDDKLDRYYEDYQWYVDDKKFKELFIEKRSELIFQDMEEDPLDYIWSSNFTIEEALHEGIISIDASDETLITEAIEYYGVNRFIDGREILNSEDATSDEFVFEDQHFYIFISF